MLQPSHEKLFIYRREYGADSVIVCCNFANEQITLPQDISGTIILGSLHTKDMLGPYGFAVFSSQETELWVFERQLPGIALIPKGTP